MYIFISVGAHTLRTSIETRSQTGHLHIHNHRLSVMGGLDFARLCTIGNMICKFDLGPC